MLFDGWDDLGRIAVVGIGAYAGLIVILRVTGKRTLSKMNAFDFVVTVALGSTLASIFLSSDVSLSEGLFALALLCLLQYAVAFVSARSARFQGWVKADPVLLVYQGRLMSGPMRRERVTREEVLAAARSQGINDLAFVRAVILETDGSFTILPPADSEALATDTLDPVNGVPAPERARVP